MTFFNIEKLNINKLGKQKYIISHIVKTKRSVIANSTSQKLLLLMADTKVVYCLYGYADGSPPIDNSIRPAVICPPLDSIACAFDRINRQLSRV